MCLCHRKSLKKSVKSHPSTFSWFCTGSPLLPPLYHTIHHTSTQIEIYYSSRVHRNNTNNFTKTNGITSTTTTTTKQTTEERYPVRLLAVSREVLPNSATNIPAEPKQQVLRLQPLSNSRIYQE
jgi:fatty acid desaturase